MSTNTYNELTFERGLALAVADTAAVWPAAARRLPAAAYVVSEAWAHCLAEHRWEAGVSLGIRWERPTIGRMVRDRAERRRRATPTTPAERRWWVEHAQVAAELWLYLNDPAGGDWSDKTEPLRRQLDELDARSARWMVDGGVAGVE